MESFYETQDVLDELNGETIKEHLQDILQMLTHKSISKKRKEHIIMRIEQVNDLLPY